jgi:hypothetical protein
MRKQPWPALVTLAALALAGCGRGTAPVQSAGGGGSAPAGSDQQQVAGVLADNPQYVNEDAWQSSAPQAFDGAGFAAVRPLRFWRTIRSVTRTDDTQFGEPDTSGRPTLALVTVHRDLVGELDLVAGAVDPTDTSRTLVQKPLHDLWTRKLLLHRGPDPRDGRLRWHLIGTSGVEVHTQGGSTRLASVRIQSGAVDTTITDPLELHRLRRVVLVTPGEPVTLTATTGNASDVVLFYGFDTRRRFTNNGDGTFTFTFPAGRFPGLRNFGVDALSNGTLFDDQAPYDANGWVFPFVTDPHRAPVDGS